MIPLLVGTCLLLAMVPGPGAMIILRQMMLHGRHLAVFTLMGNELSLILWGVASGAGFAVIIVTSPPAFATMQPSVRLCLFSSESRLLKSVCAETGAGAAR